MHAGITLGEALTTSGAAVSSNMGPDASRAMTFLLTVFNARLGVWLGNPGVPGDATWKRAAPAFGVAPLVSELLAQDHLAPIPTCFSPTAATSRTWASTKWCFAAAAIIVLSDAGCDGGYTFGDLANAVRKIRIDFGIDIDFPAGLHIAPHGGIRRTRAVRHCVSPWERFDTRRSIPSSRTACSSTSNRRSIGDEPVDVANYARTHATFPHESTTEQWFDEAQFESYRMLGLQTVTTCVRRRTVRECSRLVPRGAPRTAMTMRKAVIVGGIFLAGVVGGWMLAVRRSRIARHSRRPRRFPRRRGRRAEWPDRRRPRQASTICRRAASSFPSTGCSRSTSRCRRATAAFTSGRFSTTSNASACCPIAEHAGNPVRAAGRESRSRASKLNGDEMIGLNCSACHVGQVQYQHHAVRIDGAGNMAYVNKFLEHLASETEATITSPQPAGALLGTRARGPS